MGTADVLALAAQPWLAVLAFLVAYLLIEDGMMNAYEITVITMAILATPPVFWLVWKNWKANRAFRNPSSR